MILDGAMGTMIQRYGLTEADYRSGELSGCAKELKGNSECLNLTRPDIIKAIHREYIEAGADIIESNTFSANKISQAEYGCESFAAEMAYEGARLAREVADEAIADGQKVWVAGSMGPTSKSLSLSPDVSDPARRCGAVYLLVPTGFRGGWSYTHSRQPQQPGFSSFPAVPADYQLSAPRPYSYRTVG